jgi:CBS domain-containing protein
VLKISEIMTGEVATVTPEATLKEVVELLAVRHVSGAPVVAGNSVVGVITAADILCFATGSLSIPAAQSDDVAYTDSAAGADAERETVPPASYFTELWAEATADVADRMTHSETTEWDVLDEHTVDEVMTRSVCSLPPNHSVFEAAELMRQKSIHRVLVVNDGRLVGIVSALDIVRAVADHRLTERRYIFNPA